MTGTEGRAGAPDAARSCTLGSNPSEAARLRSQSEKPGPLVRGRLEADLRFAILGPLEVHFRGRPVLVRGLRERIALSSLLLAEGRAVSLDRLIETVWDADPPRAAAKAVRNSISALRQRLAESGASASVIGTEHEGYRLQLDGCYLDAQDFRDRTADARRAAAAGQAEQAAAELRAALALWRGSALSGLGGAHIELEAASLNEQRLTALEECLDLELSLGRHRQLVSELQAVAAEHPLRERLAGQLMIALYRSGRQAEALEAYRKLARRLADDLGIDPAAEVARLHEAILRQDLSLDISVPVSAGEAGLVRPPRSDRRDSSRELAVAPGEPADGTGPGNHALAGVADSGSDALESAPSHSRRGGRQRSPRWRAVLWSAGGLGAIALAGAYLFWPSAAPVRHTANPAATVRVARDNTDPYVDGCTADRKAIDWEPVYWSGRKLFGSIVLYYSRACQAAWGYLYAPNSVAWTIHIIPDRPTDHVSIPWRFSGNTGNGSWSNVLSTRSGCVYIEAFVSSKAGTGPQAITPCFTGTVPETRKNR
jgi:DNA-binding SARP family transcriptional activator